MAIEFLPLSGSRLILLILYNILAVIFVILAIRVYNRGKKTQQTAYIVKFFAYVGFSLIMNIIYAPIADKVIQRVGNNTVILLTTLGVANLMLFTLSLRYSIKELTHAKSLLIEACCLLLTFGYYLIPGGTTIKMPDYSPIWSTNFLIYGLIITQLLMITTFIIGTRVYISMKAAQIKKRFQIFMIGVLFVEILLIATFLGNAQILTGTIRLILALTIFPSAFLIYSSVGRPLENN
jgi:hypothetical protein